MAQQTIVTNQYVRIQQTPASVGERIFARIIDYVIIAIYLWLYYRVINYFDDVGLSRNSIYVFAITLILPVFFYSPIWEIFNHGQSPGKLILHMRVVKTDGSVPSIGSTLLRWLIYLVEGPSTSFLGIIPIIINRRNQRLGDLAAGTMVIKDNSYERVNISLDEFDYLTKDYVPTFPQAEELSINQATIIQRTLYQKNDERQTLIEQLAAKVKETFAITTNLDDELFLERFVRDYQYYAAIEI